MFSLFGIAFLNPLLLGALALLPLVWIILRAVPPAPIRRAFPGVMLLLGLKDKTAQTDRTPWWLLLLRIVALALIIIGFAGPVRNPVDTEGSNAPLLIAMDASWASAATWPERLDRVTTEITNATRSGRPVAIVKLTDPQSTGISFTTGSEVAPKISGLKPNAWEPLESIATWAGSLEGSFDTIWLSDGILRDQSLDILSAFERQGDVVVVQPDRQTFGLTEAAFDAEGVNVKAVVSKRQGTQTLSVNAIGPGPAGVTRILTTAEAEIETSTKSASVALKAPLEVRNRFARFEIVGQSHAGAVLLADDSLKRREIALFAGREGREGLQLLSPTHFLRQALSPSSEVIDGALLDILPANPDVIILADVAILSSVEEDAIKEWVQAGGILLRFAGPRLAASDLSRNQEDILMPVRLRAGGRTIGGAMSWGNPRSLKPFARTSPFFGLTIPSEVQVNAQVLAEPDPNLAQRTIAELDDGTPLVTRKTLGQGQVILFHVTANADWSGLPISGLFVEMLERLAVSSRDGAVDIKEFVGTTWQPLSLLNGFGQLEPATLEASVRGEDLSTAKVSANLRPGLYAHDDRIFALNTLSPGRELEQMTWPERVAVQGLASVAPQLFKGIFLILALALLAVDAIASLWLSGRLRNMKAAPVLSLLVLILPIIPTNPSHAQTAEAFAQNATAQTVLAYVLTGDEQLDRISHAGLTGLSDELFARTSVEPANPIGVNLETDELSFFPVIYWPITLQQQVPSAQAYARLNRYLRGGGLILFDTRDANTSSFGATSPNSTKLQTLALSLDIPPLEPVPDDHILTRTFYLLQDFPGRYLNRDVWVEASVGETTQADGMPFRNLNDNVTPVLIGGNDWASAWAVDETGNWMFPVGRGLAGERQREFAIRFGVNLVMHVLTGNYKSDQVHVPALLERLGQ